MRDNNRAVLEIFSHIDGNKWQTWRLIETHQLVCGKVEQTVSKVLCSLFG
jgi:hypothetical protein